MNDLSEGIDLNNLHEPAYVWVGHLVPNLMLAAIDYDEDKSDAFPMLVSLNSFQDFPKEMKPMAEYFRCPRLQSEASSWLVECGGIEALDWLEQQRCVLRINPENVLASFADVHLENNGILKAVDDFNPLLADEPSLTMMGNNPDSKDITLTEVMRDLLFGYYDESLPVAVQECADLFKKPQDAVAKELFVGLAALLRDDYAFLLYVDNGPSDTPTTEEG